MIYLGGTASGYVEWMQMAHGRVQWRADLSIYCQTR
jgi:hypothetical protein